MESSYMDDAEPVWYLNWAWMLNRDTRSVCAAMHDIFRNKVSGSSLLDIGCGPSLVVAIAAGTMFDHVVLADFNPKHRQYLRRWLDGDESEYDWNIYVDVFADLDSASDKEKYRKTIRDHLRKYIKDVCFADVNQPNPLTTDDLLQFDVVTATYLFEEFERVDMKMTNAANLLKPGGTFLLISDVEASTYYDVNHEFVIQGISRTVQDFETHLVAAGLTIVHKQFFERSVDESDSKGTVILLAEKQRR